LNKGHALRVRDAWRAGAVCLVALAGGVGFFVYCQVRFGAWDLYMQSQSALWGIHVDYFSLFRPQTYRLCLAPFEAGQLGPNDLSRLSVPLTLLTIAGLLACEWRQLRREGDTGWRGRLWFYLAAGLMFYLSVCGLKERAMASMIRYTLPVAVMLVLAVVHGRCHRQPAERPVRGSLWCSAALASVALGLLQLKLAYQFTHGGWVA
ncbi:MAG TPA: hypothetical protein VFA18_16770, partial [Gemmataceae bacterium]|nr:hypothetical protein [Gemmataceae bacterium]